ncbi:MAG: RNA-binding protein, partial [bacterium]|nr:RNA-binding protein [bacterium]
MSQTTSLFVGNLSYATTADQLRELFAPWGPVEDARVVEGRGFGFVDIPSEHMQAAIDATNGQVFMGRTITVNQARPRTERREGGFRSDRG